MFPIFPITMCCATSEAMNGFRCHSVLVAMVPNVDHMIEEEGCRPVYLDTEDDNPKIYPMDPGLISRYFNQMNQNHLVD